MHTFAPWDSNLKTKKNASCKRPPDEAHGSGDETISHLWNPIEEPWKALRASVLRTKYTAPEKKLSDRSSDALGSREKRVHLWNPPLRIQKFSQISSNIFVILQFYNVYFHNVTDYLLKSCLKFKNFDENSPEFEPEFSIFYGEYQIC